MADIFVLPGAQREDDHRRKNVIYLQNSEYESQTGIIRDLLENPY